MSDNKTRRESPAVNAGSMADIAFLLLIFFLVTTTIQEDQGVLVKLPEYLKDQDEVIMNNDNVLTVLVNAEDAVMVEDDRVGVDAIPGLLRRHVISPERKPTQAIVSLTHDRGTSYERYLQVYDALKAGYSDLWEERAQRDHGMTYEALSASQQKAIRKVIPLVISEAEPKDLSSLVVE